MPSPARPAGLMALAALLALVGTLAPAAPATAGEFEINACQADRQNFSTQVFGDFATRGMNDALQHLEHERTTVACNKFYARGPADLKELERRLRERRLHRSVAIPHDDQLASMLDTATYQLDALERTSRMALKRLGLAVMEQLV